MKTLSSLLFLLFLSFASTAQFKENHNYILGGWIQAATQNDIISFRPRIGKVLSQGNVIGLTGSYLSIENNVNSWSVSGWYRFTKELEIVSFPIFYRTDTELGYLDNGEDGAALASVRPGFTVPLTKRTYLDFSIATLQFVFDDDLEASFSLNNFSLGLILGL